MSYPWANALLFQLAGGAPPSRPSQRPRIEQLADVADLDRVLAAVAARTTEARAISLRGARGR
jgi:hypothetical protein